MRGFIKVVSGGLTIFKEWRIVELLKRYMEMIIWKLIQWVNHKNVGLIQKEMLGVRRMVDDRNNLWWVVRGNAICLANEMNPYI